MSDRIGGFKTSEDAERYYARYDEFAARRWPVPHDELDLPTRFGATRVRRSGPDQGIPLVLIHPTTGSSVGWYPLIAPLCERHPVLTPDTIGTAGRSVQTRAIRSPGDLVVWLDDVLDGLDVERIHLIGYSEGGWIAGLHAALTDRPHRLATLTLIEPGGAIERLSPPFVASMIVRGSHALLAKDKHRAVRDFSRWMNGDVELTDDQIDLLLLAMRTFHQRLPTPGRLSDHELRRITAPTLLLMGSDTKLYDPLEVAARARRLLPDLAIDITPGAGHGLAFQHPHGITTRILEFVEGAEERATGASP